MQEAVGFTLAALAGVFFIKGLTILTLNNNMEELNNEQE